MLQYRLNGVAAHRRAEPDELRASDHARPNLHSSRASAPK